MSEVLSLDPHTDVQSCFGDSARPCRRHATKVGLEINTAAVVADENVFPAPSGVNSSRLSVKRTTFNKELGNVAVSIW